MTPPTWAKADPRSPEINDSYVVEVEDTTTEDRKRGRFERKVVITTHDGSVYSQFSPGRGMNRPRANWRGENFVVDGIVINHEDKGVFVDRRGRPETRGGYVKLDVTLLALVEPEKPKRRITLPVPWPNKKLAAVTDGR